MARYSRSRVRFNLTGARFGRLLALSYEGKSKGWICQCDCGAVKNILGGNLRSGRVVSCGCAHTDELSLRNRTHGQRDTTEYKTWCNIRSRCSNPRAVGYEYYGGRGVSVCERWNSFENFLADMGPKPSAHHSIDRIDVNGNYEPSNCRWATRREQMSNTTRNVFVVLADGERVIQAEAARRAGIAVGTLKYRQRMQAINGNY